MSLSYAESLSYFPHKGKVGMPELGEKPEDLQKKLEQLEQMIRQSRHTVVITGAGISTSAGIPDFRGPNGVWTLEKRGEKPSFNKGFDQAQPTYTHRALYKLEQNNYVHFVISQNIDGLHHRSGLALEKLAELHGNVYAEECEVCHTQVINPTCVGSYCRKRTGNVCNTRRGRNKDLKCRGKLRDTVLDWEDPLPELALQLSEHHCSQADLCLCLGTSLQIRPCRDLPRKTKKKGGQVVIVNLQKTTMDSIASLIIHERCDHVLKYIMEKLNINMEEPTIKTDSSPYGHVQRTILLCGESFSDPNGLAEKLAVDLQGLALHLNEFHPDEDTKEEKRLEKCQRLMESPKINSSTHATWIIDGITCQAEIDFFRNYFADRLVLCRRQIVKAESDSSFHSNAPWIFTFSTDGEKSFDEQIKEFLKLLVCE